MVDIIVYSNCVFLGVLLILGAGFVGAELSPADGFCQQCECKTLFSSSVAEVYCSNLTNSFFIPTEIRTDLRKLVLTHCKLSPVLKKLTVTYPNLYHLGLPNCGVTSVEKHAFRSFPRLELIDLRDNHITFLDPKTFISDKYLLTLILAGNNISLPTDRPFLNAPRILNLDISRCNIKELPAITFQNMPNLISLNLSNNKIDLLFGDEFERLENLYELNLDYNGLKLINSTTFKTNVRLKKLSLRGNYFLTLDTAGYRFLSIPSLEMLWLDGSEFLSLPSYSFKDLKNLTYLSVNNNILKTIQFGDIQHLPTLKYLSALENNLKCGCIGEYKDLCCSWNELEVIASCSGTSWEVAKDISCSEEFSFWGYLKPWQWKMAAAIMGGCVAMFVISLLLAKGPCLKTKINMDSAVENIYL